MKLLHTFCFFFFLLYMANGQNVGIGTANPQRRLDVAGGIRADSLFLQSGTGDSAVLSLKVADVITFAQNLQCNGFGQVSVAVAQSVTAEISDTLHYISVFTSAPIQADTIKVYDGVGLDGLLLATATMEDGTGWVKSSLLNIYLEEGEEYTFWINNIHYVSYTLQDAYPGGGVIEQDTNLNEADLTFSLNSIGDLVSEPVRVTGHPDEPGQLPPPFPGVQMELKGHLSVNSLSMAQGAGNGSVMTGDSAGNISWQPSAWTANQYGLIVPTNPNSYIGIGTTTPQARLHMSGYNGNILIGDYGQYGSYNPLTIYGDGQVMIESADGTPRLFMDGYYKNAGIGGYPVPGERLSVFGKLSADEIKLGIGAAPGYLLTSDDYGNASWQSPPVQLWEQNGNNITNTTVGNVGIGNNNPIYTLDVIGSAKFTESIHSLHRIGAGISPQVPLHVYSSTSTPLAIFQGDDFNHSIIEIHKAARFMTFGLVEDRAIFGPNNNDTDLEFQTNGSAKVFIKPSGNVGIGTDVPTEKLQVEGKTRTQTFQMTNGAGVGKLLVSDAGGSASWTDPIWSGSGTTFFLANASGNVGVGTSSPASKLEVDGTLTADQIKLTTNPGLNKLLTSDVNGLASWATPNWQTNGSNMYSTPVGFVGLGTNNPTQKLHVVGNAIVTGSITLGSIQQSAVTEIPLAYPFSNWGGDYELAGYYKDKENVVHLQGLIAVSTLATFITIYQLPAGFRPAKSHVFATMDSNSAVRLDVDQNGNIKLMDMPADAFLSLDGISFRVE